MKPEQIFEIGLQYHHYANTAYPLTPKSFKDFRINNESEYLEFINKEWSKTDKLSLYIHIPFCKVRCKFCEYAVLENTDTDTEDTYVSLLLKEIEMYKPILKGKHIVGYDIGGGTPTKLSIENIKKITNALKDSFSFDKDVVFSIETTPVIAAHETEKLKAIYHLGYKRISMGIQTISERLLNELGREGTTHIYEKAAENIRNAGFQMFNIDLMYGFLHQNDEDFENTLRYAIALKPEYITLYRNRYKGTKLEKEAEGVSLYKIISQYRLAYKILNENGYYGNAGKNTFSRIENDYGTSDYLTKRVIEGVSYVGMGLGAQSFGENYLAYNEGAASKKLNRYKEKIENNKIPVQDIYALDLEESIAKMVSVAFYFGFVDLQAFHTRFGISFTEHFKSEVEYVLKNSLMEIINNRIILTHRGADYINGIIPLFYSQRSKKELMHLYNHKPEESNGELEFLKAYNINEFERPSIATDIVVLASDNHNKQSIHNAECFVLLIKRGEHPYMNDWALPGGFVRSTESIEQAAARELKEETGISGIFLRQLHVFSEPKRDPRGWVISSSFVASIDKNNVILQFGDDAIDAQFFRVRLSQEGENVEYCNPNFKTEKFSLELESDTKTLSATIEKQSKYLGLDSEDKYEIIESKGIAFDHAKIVLVALERLKNE